MEEEKKGYIKKKVEILDDGRLGVDGSVTTWENMEETWSTWKSPDDTIKIYHLKWTHAKEKK